MMYLMDDSRYLDRMLRPDCRCSPKLLTLDMADRYSAAGALDGSAFVVHSAYQISFFPPPILQTPCFSTAQTVNIVHKHPFFSL